jgi:hypothetical protein
METLKEYWDYKNRVEAKTNGADVHKVNGLLGLIINSVGRLERHRDSALVSEKWAQWDKEDRERITATVLEIAQITGVHP